MTAEYLAKIEQMNAMGLNDTIIGETIGYNPRYVSHCRKMLGLPIAGINRTTKRYTIYDGETTQFIMEGSARECAERMGISIGSFRSLRCRFERGQYKKYEIYPVEEE